MKCDSNRASSLVPAIIAVIVAAGFLQLRGPVTPTCSEHPAFFLAGTATDCSALKEVRKAVDPLD